jgi:hypothetical protein
MDKCGIENIMQHVDAEIPSSCHMRSLSFCNLLKGVKKNEKQWVIIGEQSGSRPVLCRPALRDCATIC